MSDQTPPVFRLAKFTVSAWAEFIAAPAEERSIRFPAGGRNQVSRIAVDDYLLCYVPKVGFVAGAQALGPAILDPEDATARLVRARVLMHTVVDLETYTTNAVPFGAMCALPQMANLSRTQRVAHVQTAARPFDSDLAQALGELIAVAGNAPLRSMDPEAGSYEPRAQAVQSASERQGWAGVAAQVLAKDEAAPISEVVRRARARGYIDGEYEELLLEATGALEASDGQAVTVSDEGHVRRVNTHQDAPKPPVVDDVLGTADLSTAVSRHRSLVKKELLNRLHAMDPFEFEEYVGLVLSAVGVEDTEVTKPFKDGGVDIRGVLRSVTSIRQPLSVQVKRWQSNVGVTHVQQLRGTLAPGEIGLVVTTSGYTSEAREDASGAAGVTPIFLLTGDDLAELALEHQVGVKRKSAVQFELVDLQS